MKKLFSISFIIALAVLTLLTGTTYAQVKNQSGFVIKPVKTNAISSCCFVYEVPAGTTIKDTAFISNNTDFPVTFYLYGADGTKTKEGKFAVTTQSEEQKQVGAWTAFSHESLALTDESKFIPFTINIPENLPDGLYEGAIVMERQASGANAEGFKIASRIAIRAIITVTDNPLTIPRKAIIYQFPPLWEEFLSKYYFWVSLALLVISVTILAVSYLKGKKK